MLLYLDRYEFNLCADWLKIQVFDKKNADLLVLPFYLLNQYVS